jgi:hypothetical protein
MVMSAEEQQAAWCVPAEEPWFRALMKRLDDHIADSQIFVTMPASAQNHGTLASAAGRLDALLTLREDLAAARAEAFEAKK